MFPSSFLSVRLTICHFCATPYNREAAQIECLPTNVTRPDIISPSHVPSLAKPHMYVFSIGTYYLYLRRYDQQK